MTAINFDQPSKGEVSDTIPTLTVTNNGDGEAVHAESKSDNFAAISAIGQNWMAVSASSDKGHALYAKNESTVPAVRVNSHKHQAIAAESRSDEEAAIAAYQRNSTTNNPVPALYGFSKRGEAVHASSESDKHAAINSYSPNYEAVHAETYSDQTAAIAAHQRNSTTNNPVAALFGYSERGEGVHAESSSDKYAALTGWHKNKKLAGYFHGDVAVTGDVRLVNADCAEEFDISSADAIEPGTVMVINQTGNLEQSHQPYDKRVAGIVCGAGDYKPGIILDKKQSDANNKRLPIALIGKVYCKVDADYSSIEVGDLLTSSITLGHAMKALDPNKAFGAVIGKALKPLEKGRGMIPVLVALQ